MQTKQAAGCSSRRALRIPYLVRARALASTTWTDDLPTRVLDSVVTGSDNANVYEEAGKDLVL